ncbi:MAG: transcriptional regulator [Hyphomicrobiales bacterium]|jgi:LysR family nitrogen assimilation transcriptional regulator|nr:transcriptional regulator [Hyphomicrobiales bacterium]
MLLRQLRYFLTVAEAGSFTAAAQRMHVSQPALGYQVKQLEEKFGVALLERHSRGIRPTPAGEVLAQRARTILAEVEAAETVLAAFRVAPAAPVSLGVTPTPGRALAPELVAAALGVGPRIALREGLSDELARLVSLGELDAALCYDPLSTERLDILRLYTEDLYLVGPPRLIGSGDSRDITFDELTGLPLVLDGRFQAGRRIIEGIAGEQKAALDLIEAEAVTVKRELLVRHGRCSIVPLGLFFEEIGRGQLAARRVVAPRISRTLVLATRKGLAADTVKALAAAIVPLVAQRIEAGDLAWRAP